ncbi:GntR family transcriptional regulator [Nonomuraea pusilla]|uniref:GntR family transcriptional regulator n=1 Tax=Nonomuraea pusilla TaxID=46177 RepID=UPI003322CC2E
MARRKVSTINSGAAAGARPAADQTFAAVKPPLSRADYVQSVLREEILSGALPPGTPILQDEVGARLGVSVTPVREALRRLESLGLVDYKIHGGATVVELSQSEIEELYALRATVEGLAARLAAEDVDDKELDRLRAIHQEMKDALVMQDARALASGSRRFHAAVAEVGGRRIIARHLGLIWEGHPIPLTRSVWSDTGLAAAAIEFHERILGALEAGDSVTAERLMREHVELAVSHRLRGAAPVRPTS